MIIGNSQRHNLYVGFSVILTLCVGGQVFAAEYKLAGYRYNDPKEYFRIVPPDGWQVKEYLQDSRGKVAFTNYSSRLGVVVQRDDIGNFDELVQLSEDIERRIGISTNIEKDTFGGREVVKRTFKAKGQQFISISFIAGTLTHNLTFSASPNEFERFLPVVSKSMETYEPLVRRMKDQDISDHQVDKKRRLAQLMIDEGNYRLALDFINEGLEWAPRDEDLLNLKEVVESKL